MESEWEPERFHDTHREKVEALIQEKSQGKVISIAEIRAAPKVVDLMEALQASIRATQSDEKKPCRQNRPDRRSPPRRLPASELLPQQPRKLL